MVGLPIMLLCVSTCVPSPRWGLLVIQQDVSSNVTMEERLADLAESQLAMMSAIFPRHILEFLAAGGTGNLQVGRAQCIVRQPQTCAGRDLLTIDRSSPQQHLALLMWYKALMSLLVHP
jgi:hypothetical protein